MRARKLVEGAAFDPATVAVAVAAFDGAWAEISAQYTEPAEVDTARVLLAKAVLSVTSEDSRDVDVLKAAALQVIASDFTMKVDKLKRQDER